MRSSKRVVLVLACLTAAAVLAGVVFLNTGLASERTAYTQLRVLTEVLGLITENYVEKVDGGDLVDGAISGLLSKLDPHSNYLDPERYKRMQERNRGLYYGVGISFEIVNGDLTVVSAIEGSPSAKLGIRPGDIIIKIDGQSAKGIKQEDVFDRLRGERGTIVHVTIKRPGENDPLEFDIVRDEIPIYSVPYSFMIRPGIGYIRMIRFAGTTSDELEKALQKLEAEGMEKLILDIRGNAGGYLNEAIEVADKFLPAGRKLVYTVGRLPDSNEEYFSTGRGQHTRYPLIVMIDHYSASASEIVSGAMQDWDRGLIVGETSFGKGLVQRQYPLMNEGALVLTVARYYTPSGRLIQRDYTNKEKYLTEDVAEIEQEAVSESAAVKMPEFKTAGGRIVHGGGGISPDVKLTEGWEWSKLQLTLQRQYFDFANQYVNEARYAPQSFDEFRRDFAVADDVLQKFEDFLKERNVSYSPDSMKNEIDKVRSGIRREMARNLFGENERWQLLMEEDPQIKPTLALFPQAESMARREAAGDWQTRSQ